VHFISYASYKKKEDLTIFISYFSRNVCNLCSISICLIFQSFLVEMSIHDQQEDMLLKCYESMVHNALLNKTTVSFEQCSCPRKLLTSLAECSYIFVAELLKVLFLLFEVICCFVIIAVYDSCCIACTIMQPYPGVLFGRQPCAFDLFLLVA